MEWTLVVPVKGGTGAKSRVRPPAGVARAELAAAFALDTLAAAVAAVGAGRVLVVTRAGGVGGLGAGLPSGCVRVDDPGDGLAAAVDAGVRVAAGVRLAAGEGSAIGVLLGDLPALHPADLGTALAEAARHPRAFVPDRAGTGTVLLTGMGGIPVRPRFGTGSADRHERAGHVRLDLDLPRLRTDVDDEDDLAAAVALGVGPHTAAVLARAEGSVG